MPGLPDVSGENLDHPMTFRCLCVASLLGLAPLHLSAASPLDLKALLDQGRAEEAYRLGRASADRLGDPAFDYAFGVAAIAAGKAGEGVMALERFMLNHPDHDAARVELARGYFVLGDEARAREEFEAALARKPAPAVVAVIEEYLAAIREREAKYRPTAMAYFMLGAGHDSNPRAGVDNPEITLPVFGPVTVVDSGVQRSDRMHEAGAGFRLTAPFSPRVTAFAAGSAEASRHPEIGEFDQATFAGTIGAAGRRDRWAWRGAASTSYQKLGGEPYRRVRGLSFDASWIPDGANAFSGGIQGGRFIHDGANAVRDSDFLSVAAGWRRLMPGPWRPEFEVAGNAGREKNRREARQDLSRDLLGARLSGRVSPWRAWTLGAGVSYLRSDYLDPDLALQTTREDRYLAGELSVEWRFAPSLSARAEILFARNRANIELYEYARHTAALRLRYETR